MGMLKAKKAFEFALEQVDNEAPDAAERQAFYEGMLELLKTINASFSSIERKLDQIKSSIR